jgi:hypothetical protein
VKIRKIAMLILAIALALYILIPGLSWAEDGPGLYRAKCPAHEGPDGSGKPAVEIQNLVSGEAKKNRI